jgi:LacI family transcriptional regulator
MPRKLKTTTAHDVARLAGVSQATVSYVLSGRRSGKLRVSDETRQRVMEAVSELNYVPNDAARSLRRRRSERICLVVQRLGVPFDDVLARDVQRMADSHSYSLVITLGGTLQRERHVLGQLRRGLADGAIIIPAEIGPDDLAPLVDAGLALVVLANWKSELAFDAWYWDDGAAAYQAVAYLIELGHRRIGFVGHSLERGPHNPRFESYLRALADHGIVSDPRLSTAGAASRQSAYEAARALLAQPERPTAVFATADVAAMSAILAAQDIGLRVPHDLALIGTGNIPEGELIRPRLTTAGPREREFTPVAELLFSRLASALPLPGRMHLDPWELIRRESA